MKLVLGLFGFGLFAASFWPSPPSQKPWTLVISGDTRGYLSPCGCVKPMAGGIRRRATAIRAMGEPRIVLENASLSGGIDRQDELKLDAQAEALTAIEVDAINLGVAEAQLGQGAVLNLSRLSGEKLITGSLAPSPNNELKEFIEKGPLLVGGVSTRGPEIAAALREVPRSVDSSVADLVAEAKRKKKLPIVMLDGLEADARKLAQSFPDLAAVIYQSTGEPSKTPLRLRKTLLLSPGEKGKFILRLTVQGNQLAGYAPIKLNPEYKDDPKVSEIYATYLQRVDQENLLDRVPRTDKGKFVGSKACSNCHSSDYEIWTKTRHAGALKTLEDDGHGRDPDCVGCHVVALDALSGFQSRSKTPFLSDVGCESCHGPGATHSADPGVKMGKAGAPSCAPCHNSEHSPGFDYESYWAKIKHGI